MASNEYISLTNFLTEPLFWAPLQSSPERKQYMVWGLKGQNTFCVPKHGFLLRAAQLYWYRTVPVFSTEYWYRDPDPHSDILIFI